MRVLCVGHYYQDLEQVLRVLVRHDFNIYIYYTYNILYTYICIQYIDRYSGINVLCICKELNWQRLPIEECYNNNNNKKN